MKYKPNFTVKLQNRKNNLPTLSKVRFEDLFELAQNKTIAATDRNKFKNLINEVRKGNIQNVDYIAKKTKKGMDFYRMYDDNY